MKFVVPFAVLGVVLVVVGLIAAAMFVQRRPVEMPGDESEAIP